jgi:hypothetical protein
MVEEDERFVDLSKMPKSSLEFAIGAWRRQTFNEELSFFYVFILFINLSSFLKRLDIDLDEKGLPLDLRCNALYLAPPGQCYHP